MNELKKKKPEKAMPHLEKALEMYPQYAVAWFAKGQALEGMKKLDEAVAAYDKAIEADSKFLSPYLRLATIAASGNQWEKAEQYSATTIRMNPVDFPFAYYLNALSNLQLQNFTKAEESAKEALKMDPGHRMARLDYFLALILANQRKYDEAATHMKAFMKLLPEGTDTAQYQTQLSQIEQMALTERNQSPNP
jgi:superkiller protein 3